MSRGMLRCWTLDPSWDDLIERRLPRKTCVWMIGEGIELLAGLSKEVAVKAYDSSKNAFDLSYTLTDEISMF